MIELSAVLQAKKNFKPEIVRDTPCEYSESLSKKYQAHIYIKREDLQHVRSFKIRGAYNFISTLPEIEQKKGIVCASAGNHAQGVALSCNTLHIKGTIFMPQTTPKQKIRKTKKFGGEFVEIQLIGDNFNEAFTAAKAFCKQQGAVFVHPFDDLKVITGQATIGLEIIEQVDKEIDYVLVAIGGGGLISGVSSVFKELSPTTKIIGIESEGSASMYQSVKNNRLTDIGRVDTFCDGVAVKVPGALTYQIVKETVENIQIVPDGQTATTLLEMLDDQGIILEPAGALAIAGLENIKDQIIGKTVVCIACGGNFDFARLPDVKEKSLKFLGLKRYFIINFPQRPGALGEFLKTLGIHDDIVLFEYMKKTTREAGPALVGIESNDSKNFDIIIDNMTQQGIHFEDITAKQMYYELLV